MSRNKNWNREQLLVAYSLYCRLPFGKLDARNSEVEKYAVLIGRTKDALALKLVNIASLDPVITSTGRVGMTNAAKADRAMWSEMSADWGIFEAHMNNALNQFSPDDAIIAPESKSDTTNYIGCDIATQTTARRGQRFFREAVLSAYDFKCCVTGLSIPRLLIASHIKPWKDDEKNRLNPHNGLAMNTLHDKAFDAGMMTINDDMTIKFSQKIEPRKDDKFYSEALHRYNGKKIILPSKFFPNSEFLNYHRENIFENWVD